MSKQFVPPVSFNARLQVLFDIQSELQTHGCDWRRTTALLRNAAYNAAVTYIAIQREQHNDLLRFIRGRGLKTVDEFIAQVFAGVVGTGIEPGVLIRAIQAGFTLADWSTTTPALYLQRQAARAAMHKPQAQRTDADWRAIVSAQGQQIVTLRRELAAARQELRAKQNEIRQLMRTLGATRTQAKVFSA